MLRNMNFILNLEIIKDNPIIMASECQVQCPKHSLPTLFICSVEDCIENRLICETCKQKETLHFSHHANYIYRFKQFKDFNNSKNTINRLEKGIGDCENYISVHKKYYSKEVDQIKEDIQTMRQEFMKIADKYEEIYIQGFQKEIDKFDELIQNIKVTFKDYSKEKENEESFFSKLFPEKAKSEEQAIQSLVKKNSKAFKVRADIINLRSSIAMAKNNKTKYKQSEVEQHKFRQLVSFLTDFTTNLFDKFKEILQSNSNDSDNLRSSIISQSKSLAMSRVSLGSPLELTNDLRRSTVDSINSDRSIQQRVAMPEPHQIVCAVREKLKPLNPPSRNITMEGPYLYSTGVYFGQFENGRRTGWGEYVFKDGSLYEGGWQNDTMTGYGRLIRNNCYYEGEVKDSKAQGKGNYEDQYRTYAGEWKDDKRNGIGEEEFKMKKKKYIGMFLDDKYHGKGKLIDQQYIYEGRFKEGLFHGDGRLDYKNRETFEGSFIEGKKHLGKHKYPDGSYYDGMFKNDLPEGTGEFFWADGVKFSGQWKNGLQEGIGVQILDSGRELKGLWKGGQWQKWL